MSGKLLFLALGLICMACAAAGPVNYTSKYNKSCMYTARNVSRALFLEGVVTGGSSSFIMPLETGAVVTKHAKPWQACFGPEEPMDLKKVQLGEKLPCFYRENEWGNFDYSEENACDILIKANCYCYSLNAYVGSYCEPGYGSTGRPLQMPLRDCEAATAGLLSDGARKVDRYTVYNVPSSGHYIVLAIKPATERDSGSDFHFWRLDADNTWSYKAGDTLSRNTYRNGTAITDIERPEALGAYTQFCGYFEVWPETHKLKGNGYCYSNLPARFKQWKDLQLNTNVTELPVPSPAWMAAYRGYFVDAGWEDGVPTVTEAGAIGASRKPPHTYSARPFVPPTSRPASHRRLKHFQ